ncbi:unnamed protein product, partial [Durusdinium trenchii]
EYRAAAQRLCVAPAWLSTTKLLRSAGRLATVCREELAALKLRLGVIDYAYQLKGDHHRCYRQHDLLTRAPIFQNLTK